MHPVTLVILYCAFAVLATAANLGAQRLVLSIDSSMIGFAVAIVIGTAVGLLVKYVLDNRWIFRAAKTGIGGHSRRFSLYTVMGLVTTAIFWAAESAFWLIWQTHSMRELGAVIGLAIGYAIKYQLDRKYVFRTEPSSRTQAA